MKTLVVYYSRTGTTKKVAEHIAKTLGAESVGVTDKKDRMGVKNYLIAGRDAIAGNLTEISGIEKDLLSYDVVVVGTPVWAFTMAPAIRTFLVRNKGFIKDVAFFCTEGGSGDKKTFRDMENICLKKPLAALTVNAGEVKNERYAPKLSDFIKNITA